MRGIRATILVFEALVTFFATLVALDLSTVDDATVWAVGSATAVLCLVLAGLLRHRWARLAASGLQAALVAAGLVVPVMFFLGLLFGGLWFLALYLGRKVDLLAAEQRAAAAEPPKPAG